MTTHTLPLALALDPDTRVVLIYLGIIGAGVLAMMALICVAGAKLGVDVYPDEQPDLMAGVDADGTEECPRCGGSGVVDLEVDDWYRPILRDTTCPACGGTGRVEAVWH